EIDRDRKANSPRAEQVGDAHQLRKEIVFEHARIRVYVVDRTPVDANRSQQARVIAHASKIGANAAVVEKDGAAGVATLNAAVEVVPLIDPTDRRVGLLHFVELIEGL